MDIEKITGFDWDHGNSEHCQKHGLTLQEIEQVFSNSPRITGDPHTEESRFRAIGRNDASRYVFLVFMHRAKEDGLYIRPISARYMHRKEIEKYEEAQKI